MPWINKPKKKREVIDNVAKRQEVYNTNLWHRLRKAKLRDNPLCEVCSLEGKITLGEDIHHLRSFLKAETIEERDSLAFDSNNLLTVCRKHHNEIHNGDLKGCESLDAIEQRLKELNQDNQ